MDLKYLVAIEVIALSSYAFGVSIGVWVGWVLFA
ncbi:hypothetical protein LCGC14_0409950 [marine sediment metagenome]|uniref:Uncharacterized protein n=1 Tax=marine sediment metagenome TaxID=412755 RepID=A0A0F9VG40_9ZZZZ